MTTKPEQKLIFAVPKGRILREVAPLLTACDILPEAEFMDEDSRKLRFTTNHPELDIIRVRAFDVATFVAYGGAQLGVVGSDAVEEFNYTELYSPLDLGIGTCRLSVAMPEADLKAEDPSKWSHIRVATKYPSLTARHFAKRGVQAECIKLNGAMEIAPALGLVRRIVDLVSTGSTLKANNLVEVEKILDVSSRLIVNRSAFKTRPEETGRWIEAFRQAVYPQS
ncbi:MAG: ATP phosphoribosyltransferase [Rhodospirillales bacterium]|nr:ATP phosphoribosyltransferase [Alphaproteobacteria bacterium]MCB1838949.1 ATP phosphoribosyltransferase [Alphaproteobacteria bacterium]MCB9977757.1 ATP phosphoribosyltransferase [Rhodospirillales bacterium]